METSQSSTPKPAPGETLQARGFEVPGDVAVTGFNNSIEERLATLATDRIVAVCDSNLEKSVELRLAPRRKLVTVLSGIDLADWLRRGCAGAEIPIVAVTGCESRVDHERMRPLCHEVLLKPCDPQLLLARVRTLLA